MGAGFKYKRAKSNDIQFAEDNIGGLADFLRGFFRGFFGLGKFIIFLFLCFCVPLALYIFWLKI